MTGCRIRLPVRPLLAAAYLLLWPLFLLLVTRESFDADVFGWWSQRMFNLVLVAAVVVAGATFVVLRLLLNRSRLERFEHRVVRLRHCQALGPFVAAFPVAIWVAAVWYIAWLGVNLTFFLIVGLVDLGLLVLVLECVYLCVGNEAGDQPAAVKLRPREYLVDAVLLVQSVFLIAASTFLMLSFPQAVQWGGVPTYAAVLLLTGFAVLVFFALASCSFSARSRVALLAASSTMSLYLCEGGIRVFGPPDDASTLRQTRVARRAERARELGVPFDTRTNWQFILDLRKEGTLVFPIASFVTFLREPGGQAGSFLPIDTRRSATVVDGQETLVLGHPSGITAVGVENENGYYSVFETDEHGFRNPRGIWSQPQIEIVAVGDSFTEGCEVHDKESFMSRVRDRFPQTINLGLGGGGPFTMLGCLREYGSALRPKIVLWCFYEGNDLDDMIRRSRTPILTQYLNRGFRQNLMLRQPEIDSALRSYLDDAVRREQIKRGTDSSALTLEHVMHFGTCQRTRGMLGLASTGGFLAPAFLFAWPDGPHWSTSARNMADKNFGLFRQILTTAKTEVTSWGGTLVFVYLPDFYRCADPHFAARTFHPSETDREADPRYGILRLVKELDIDVIDVTKTFARHSDPLSLYPFRQFGHFNANGHRNAAETIVEYLRRNRGGRARAD